MKIRLFNKGKGWYVSATNWKLNTDKAYMNVRFVKCEEPQFQETPQGYDIADVFVDEGKFEAYNGKISLTVFKYHTETEQKIKTDIRPSDFDDSDYPW